MTNKLFVNKFCDRFIINFENEWVTDVNYEGKIVVTKDIDLAAEVILKFIENNKNE